MKPKFIFLLFSILLTTNVLAMGFSPTSLIFNLVENEQECQTIYIDSDSERITVEDRWAENENVEWKISEFNSDASSQRIDISYPTELSRDEREVEVCLSGENEGEYHGVIILEQEQERNSIVQFGVWLKLTVSQEPPQSSNEEAPPSNTQSSSSGGGGGGGRRPINQNSSQNNSVTIQQNEEESQIQELSNPSSEEQLTKEPNEKETIVQEPRINPVSLVITILFIAIILAISIWAKKKRKSQSQ